MIMIGRIIADGMCIARDAVARFLIWLGVRPNGLTVTGAIFTAAAAVSFAMDSSGRFAWSLQAGGPSAWLLVAGGLMILASACDMLDGAVARLGHLKTEFGAFLDSTLDRFSDFIVYAGLAVYYAWSPPRANVTFVLLCMFAGFWAYTISYTKARAEDIIESCSVGFWQRGERSAAMLIAAFGCNIPALVVQQAILPALSVWRRMSYTHGVLAARQDGAMAAGANATASAPAGKTSLLDKVRFWRHRRHTWGYEITVGLNIAFLLLARFEPVDVLSKWLGR